MRAGAVPLAICRSALLLAPLLLAAGSRPSWSPEAATDGGSAPAVQAEREAISGPATVRRAQGVLVHALREAGLSPLPGAPSAAAPGRPWIEASASGKSGLEVVLLAPCAGGAAGVVAAGPRGGCAVAIAAAADALRTPRHHALRVVALLDAEAGGVEAARGWIEGVAREERRALLAALVIDAAAGGVDERPTVLPLPGRRPGSGRVFPPGWLVHAALRGGEAVGLRPAVADRRFPLLAQVALRALRPRRRSAAEELLARGVPAVLLAADGWLGGTRAGGTRAGAGGDGQPAATGEREPAAAWVSLVAATVRRLDALAGRPHGEDAWVAAVGRVWIRRDLYWLGFAVWLGLMVRGRPGRWRGRSADERRRTGRRYLPGFLFRVLFLVAWLVAPVASAALLLVPALGLLLSGRRRPPPALLRAVALAPLALLLLVAAGSVAVGAATGLAVAPLPALLVGGALVAHWRAAGAGGSS